MTGRVTSFTGQCAASNWRATRRIVDLIGYGLVHLIKTPAGWLPVVDHPPEVVEAAIRVMEDEMHKE